MAIWRCPAWLLFLDLTVTLYLKARLITSTKGGFEAPQNTAAVDAYVASYFGFVDEGIGSHVAEVQVRKGSITSLCRAKVKQKRCNHGSYLKP